MHDQSTPATMTPADCCVGHGPRAILDNSGEVLAIAHVSPTITPGGIAALREVVEAVRRMDDALPQEVRNERPARQAAAIGRARATADQAVAAGLAAALADPAEREQDEDGAP